jgi:hypothetical protein
LKTNIVLPTLNRRDKVIKCLSSIYEACYLIQDISYTYVYVYCSLDSDFEYLNEYFNICNFIFIRKLDFPYTASRFWNYHLQNYDCDIMFYLNDDVLVNPLCFANAISSMNTNFPDLDGIIGLYQENIPEDQVVKTAFGAIGTNFINRFPKKQVFCPDYRYFYLDKELEEYSNKICRLYWDTSAKLIHLHPGFSDYKPDDTHNKIRKSLRLDRDTYNKRQKLGLHWGENFELVNTLPFKK